MVLNKEWKKKKEATAATTSKDLRMSKLQYIKIFFLALDTHFYLEDFAVYLG